MKKSHLKILKNGKENNCMDPSSEKTKEIPHEMT